MNAFFKRHQAMHRAHKLMGKYPHAITIEYDVGDTDDGYGHTTEDWQTYYETNANILNMSGEEHQDGQQVKVDYTHAICFDYVPGINERMRVLYGDRIFSIVRVLDIQERGLEIELQCVEEK